MAWRVPWVLLFFVLPSGCAATRYETVPRLVERREVWSTETRDARAFTVSQKYEFGILSGKLEFTSNCRSVITEYWQDDRFRTTAKPNTAVIAGSSGVAGVAGLLSLALLSNLKRFPDSSENTDRDGLLLNRRQAATVGVSAGIVALLAVGTAFVASKDGEQEQVFVSSRKRTRMTENPEHVACGTGAPARVHLAILRDQERLAQATTDKDGNFSMWLPKDLPGTLRLVVVAVPRGMVQLAKGAAIAAFDLHEER